MCLRFLIAISVLVLAVQSFLFGQNGPLAVDSEINSRIRIEAEKASALIQNVHVLTDIYGSRLTGTPGLLGAQDWAIGELKGYGLENAHFENWDFGIPGWQNERLSAYAISPFKDSLVAEAMSWTPSTKGPVVAEAFNLIPPKDPTELELNGYLSSVAKQIKGKVVLTGKHTVPAMNFSPSQMRFSEDEARQIFAPERPRPVATPAPVPTVKRLNALEINDAIDKFLITHGARVRVYDAREPNGVIRAVVNRKLNISHFLPTIILRNEDYGRISRVLADGRSVKLEINVSNRLFPEGKVQRNLLAEISGSDKKDEVVMLGAHLDSHHLATGATDNAVGVAIVMEAVRILKKINIKPRRTIRIGLWSGEEQRVLGSQAYVEKQFGSAENPKPDFYRFNGYFNLDTGSGRIRGMRAFGPTEAGDVLRGILAPFADLGVVGASTYSNRTAPGSDHAAFSVNGLPGIYIDQDPLEYGKWTWHTSLDTFERVYENDAKQATMVVASAVYHLAMREEPFPRFSNEKMPRREYFPETPDRTKKN